MSQRIAVPAETVPASGQRAWFEVTDYSLALFNVDGQAFIVILPEEFRP